MIFPTADPGYVLSIEFVEYFIQSDPSKVRVLPKADIPVSAFVGVAGMPGQTAVYSWKVSGGGGWLFSSF
jgi:NADPH-dependent curcumin reductase CurA